MSVALNSRAALSPRHLFMVGAITALALTGCDKKGEIPKTADARVEDFASRLPATAEGAVFVGDVDKLDKTLATIKTSAGPAAQQLDVAQEQLAAQVGVDLLKPASWGEAGLSRSGMAAGVVGKQITLMAYVEDRQKFDALFAEKAKGAINATEAPKSETIDGKQVKVLSGAEGKQLAWLHEGKLVIIGTSAMEGESPVSAGQLVASMAKQDAKQSAASTEAYKQFTSGLKGYDITIYGNPTALMQNPEFARAIADESDPNAQRTADWFKANAKSLGIGIKTEDRDVLVSGFFGSTKDFNDKIADLGKSASKSPFEGFATEDVALGLRMSVNFEKGWAFYKEAMTEEQRKEIDQAIQEAGQALEMNVEEEVLKNFDGQLGVFLYSVDLAGAMGATQNPNALPEAINAVIALQFKDADKANAMVGKLVAKATPPPMPPINEDGTLGELPAPVAVVPRALEGDIKGYAIGGDAATIFVKDALVVIGTKAVPDAQIIAAIAGKPAKAKLSASANPQGKDFGDSAPYNGLYLNVQRVGQLIGPMAAMAGPEFGQLVKSVDSISVVNDANSDGLYLHLKARLMANAAAPAAAPAP